MIIDMIGDKLPGIKDLLTVEDLNKLVEALADRDYFGFGLLLCDFSNKFCQKSSRSQSSESKPSVQSNPGNLDINNLMSGVMNSLNTLFAQQPGSSTTASNKLIDDYAQLILKFVDIDDPELEVKIKTTLENLDLSRVDCDLKTAVLDKIKARRQDMLVDKIMTDENITSLVTLYKKSIENEVDPFNSCRFKDFLSASSTQTILANACDKYGVCQSDRHNILGRVGRAIYSQIREREPSSSSSSSSSSSPPPFPNLASILNMSHFVTTQILD